MDSILATIPDLEMSAQEAESAGIPRALQEMADRLGKGGPITITHAMPETKTLVWLITTLKSPQMNSDAAKRRLVYCGLDGAA